MAASHAPILSDTMSISVTCDPPPPASPASTMRLHSPLSSPAWRLEATLTQPLHPAASGPSRCYTVSHSQPRRPNWCDHASAVVVVPQETCQRRRYQVSSITLGSPAVVMLLCSSHVVVASYSNSRIMLSRGREVGLSQLIRTTGFLDIYCYF